MIHARIRTQIVAHEQQFLAQPRSRTSSWRERGSPPGQKNFGVNPGGLLNVNPFPDLGGAPVGYANLRKGTKPKFAFVLKEAAPAGEICFCF